MERTRVKTKKENSMAKTSDAWIKALNKGWVKQMEIDCHFNAIRV